MQLNHLSLASLLMVLGLSFGLGPAAISQSETDEEATEDETIAPDYFDEDLFGADTEDDEESTGEEDDDDFFNQLEIGGEAVEQDEEDESAIKDEDIGALPSMTSRDEIDSRDYASYWDTAVFRALDKVTGRIRVVEAPLEEPTTYERFEILVRQCNKRPPEETPNTTAFVEVDELALDGERKDIFTGWMFASSPGLSAVEHPVYDVWLIDCKRVAPETTAGAPEIDDEVEVGSENQDGAEDGENETASESSE